MMDTAFGKVIFGFLFGVGFVVAVSLAVFGVYQYQHAVIYDDYDYDVYKSYDQSAGLSVDNIKVRNDAQETVITARVKNNGEDSWDDLKIEAEIFDAAGEFIDECNQQYDRELAPGQAENIKISCAVCGKQIYPDNVTVSVRIIGANYISQDEELEE